jgi:hypothetical protein
MKTIRYGISKLLNVVVSIIILLISAQAYCVDTYFISNVSQFYKQGDFWYQQFTTYSSSSFVLRVASDYAIDAGVVTPSQLNSFTNNRSFTGYGLFNGQFGTSYINNLQAGTYYAVIRNRANSVNSYCLELDKQLILTPDSDGSYTYSGTLLNTIKYVSPNNGQFSEPFTIKDGYRYFIDGCNSGLNTYIISSDQISNFKSGKSFNYYKDYSSPYGDRNFPGFDELKLSPGNYYIAFSNPTSINKSVTYVLDSWKVNPANNGSNQTSGLNGISISGQCSWSTSSNYINIKVAKVSNSRSSGSLSGTLRVRVWATKNRYTGGTINGYVLGTRSLDQLKGGYYLSSISGDVTYTSPPAGDYYTTLTLEEYTNSGWVIQDYLNFSGTSRF